METKKRVRRTTQKEVVNKNVKVEIFKEPQDGNILRLLEPITVTWRDKTLTVPKGFLYDGCSTPRIFWVTVSPSVDNRTIRGATFHDFLYRTTPEGWTRKEADELFYDLIREDGLGYISAQKAYRGVRIFGGENWQSA